MNTTHSSILVSLGSLVGLGLVLCLSGCGRSDRGSAGKEASVTKDLSWCSEHGDLEGVKAFLTPANINGANDQTPPLHLAAKGGQREVADFLISQGADIDDNDSNTGWTALHFAASSGQSEMISFLIAKGASMSVSDRNGDHPIHTAARYGHVQVMKALMSAAAKPNQESANQYGDSQRNELPPEVRRLLNASAKYHPIHAAAQGNQPEVIRFLIGLGVSPDTKDANGSSPLDYALLPMGWTPSRAETIRLVDKGGTFEKAAANTISTEGYYVTDESPPRFIRFMPEELVDDVGTPYLTQRAVISFGPRGGTKPGEVAKWLYPYNQEAAKQGGFISGTYKVMEGYVKISAFDSTYQGGDITLSRNHDPDKLKLLLWMQSGRAAMQDLFPDGEAKDDPGVECKFVSWK